MVLCAGYALVAIWFGENWSETYFKIIPTLFIIGLANFLIWAPKMAYNFLRKL